MKKIIFSLFKRHIWNQYRISKMMLSCTRENLEDIQESKWAKLFKHAKTNTEYYKEIFRNHEFIELEEIYKLPVLTKPLIRKHSKHIKSKLECDNSFLVKNSTSGTTGDAMEFYTDLRDLRTARAMRGDEFVPGYRFWDKQLILWGAERDILNKRNYRYYFNRYVLGIKILSTYHMQNEDVLSIFKTIIRFKPKVVVGYPSALYFISNFMKANHINLTRKLKGIITSGEMLYPFQRELIEEVFKTKVYNRYGCREFGHIANECEIQNGLHYNADDLILEVVDDNNMPVKPGELGHILITDLNNYGFPLIRYKIGDMAILKEAGSDSCICGIKLPLLDKIEGRAFDVIHGLNGNKVSGSFWTLLMRFKVKGILKFKIEQERDYSLKLYLDTDDEFTGYEQEKLKQEIYKKLGNVSVHLKKYEFEKFSSSGKLKWIISKLN